VPYPVYTVDPYALITLGAVKEHLNIPDATTTQDNVLTRYINVSMELIERELDRKILSRSYTEYYDGRSTNRILLRNWPIISVSELWNDPSGDFTDTSNQLSASDFNIDGEGEAAIGVLLRNGLLFSKASRSIKAVYTAGYATVPYTLQEASILHIEYLYDARADRRIGISTKGKNQENTTFLTDLPDFVKNMLDPYRRMETPLSYQSVRGE
jgi:uncharacterized phiE125 gp8 family phage protein